MRLNRVILYSVVLALVVLPGCASQVIKKTEGEQPVVRALQNVDVEMASDAKSNVADGEDFDIDDLSEMLMAALNERNLLAPDGDFDLKVVINDVRIRGTGSAVLLGVFAGDDHVVGDAIVLNRQGEEVYAYTAKASYALGGAAGGDTTRLNWLYQKFSEIITDELVTKRDEAESNGGGSNGGGSGY